MVPGGLVDPFLPALREAIICSKPIVAARRGERTYMADGYARASGKFGAALCIGGPGLGNTVTPIAAAATDGSPVLLLSGEVSTATEGMGLFQDASNQTLDDVEVMKPLTRYSSSVDNPRNLGHLFRHALLEMKQQPQRPVHLSLPRDTQIAALDANTKRSILLCASITSLPFGSGGFTSLPDRRGEANSSRQDCHSGRSGDGTCRWGQSLEETLRKHGIFLWRTTLRAKGPLPRGSSSLARSFGYAGSTMPGWR